MTQKLNISKIWWRNVQPGEFYNIERHHQIEGGGGALYIEIPASLVEQTLDFLDASPQDLEKGPITIQAGVIGPSQASGPIVFKGKSGSRMRIANQNRQAPNSQRHPAWVAARGFPFAPDNILNEGEARPYFPVGGLRIYIAKTVEGAYFAGFTAGLRPANMHPNSPMWDLFPDGNRPVGGVVDAG